MPHDGHVHHHPHPHDHNQTGHADHLHSHPIANPGEVAHDDQIQGWIDNFIAGFRASEDKTGFLRLAKVPFEMAVDDGPALKLVDITIEDSFQVATASPAFASDELVYHPFPAAMVRERTDMNFVYVSLNARRDVALLEIAQLIGAE